MLQKFVFFFLSLPLGKLIDFYKIFDYISDEN